VPGVLGAWAIVPLSKIEIEYEVKKKESNKQENQENKKKKLTAGLSPH
jgi:hypothetical protein